MQKLDRGLKVIEFPEQYKDLQREGKELQPKIECP